jgi:hypothetical protein
MATCTVCGGKAGFMMSVCPTCMKASERRALAAQESTGAGDDRLARQDPLSEQAPQPLERGVETGAPLTIIGILFMLVGVWHLLNPGLPGYEGALLGRGVANLQRLAIGETFTIAGAIFLATAWRPR